MTAPPPTQLDRREPGAALRVVGRLVVVVVTLVMIAWTWRYCPDPVIDFGREIYIPWRMTQGAALYRDLNYFDGPLGPHVVAAALRVTGVSLDALKSINALVIVLVGLLVYAIVRDLSDPIAATAAGVTFAVVFACPQISGDPSFNWLTPYSHNLTYGVGLSLAMACCIGRAALRAGHLGWVAGAGVLLGLVALTKAEVLLAAIVGGVVGVSAIIWMTRLNRARASRMVMLFILAATVPVVAAIMLMSIAMPLSVSIAGVAGAWKFVGNRELLGMTYFRWLMGTDQPERNLFAMFAWAGWYGAVLLPAVLLARVTRGRSRRSLNVVAIVVPVVVLTALGYVSPRVAWAQAARPLPLLLCAIGASLLLRMLQPRGRDARIILPLTLAALSLALLAKSILRTNLAHYGFALAMPGMMLLAAALLSWVPRWAARDERVRWIPRAIVLAAWVVFVASIARLSGAQMSNRTRPVGRDRDRFLADDRGRVVNDALEFLSPHPGDTLVAIPDASLLNYLARMPGSVRYHNFLPPEVVMFGEDAMLSALRASPPDWVALVHADTRIYDAQYFGRDYARRVARWIDDNYEPAHLVGARPYTSDAFGILVMKRKPQASR